GLRRAQAARSLGRAGSPAAPQCLTRAPGSDRAAGLRPFAPAGRNFILPLRPQLRAGFRALARRPAQIWRNRTGRSAQLAQVEAPTRCLPATADRPQPDAPSYDGVKHCLRRPWLSTGKTACAPRWQLVDFRYWLKFYVKQLDALSDSGRLHLPKRGSK